MRQLTLSILVILLLFSLLSTQAVAESTVNCHCFTDRTYDHQNPEKVVPYLLATTQNSFLAVAFKANKFNLVRALMNGVPSEQLWISYFFSAKTGQDVTSLVKLRELKGNWSGTLKEATISTEQFSVTLQEVLKTKNDKLLAATVVDETILELLEADGEELKNVRVAGADNREAILSFFLAKRIKESPSQIFRSVEDNSTNWGKLAFANNVQIGKMEQEFKRLLSE